MKNRTELAKYSAYLTLEELELITNFREMTQFEQECVSKFLHITKEQHIDERAVNVVNLHK